MNKKINLCISKNCFLKCLGCYNEFCDTSEISSDEIISFLKYAKQKGLSKVTISGGDPLAREDINTIINACIELNLIVNLDTVGLPFISDCSVIGSGKIVKKYTNLSILRKIDMIGIPLDGSSNDIISKFRIFDGNLFEQLIKILNFFEESNIKICINTVMHALNLNDILNIFNLISKYDCVYEWEIFQFMPIGLFGKINRKLFEISEHEFYEMRDKIILNNTSNIKIIFKSEMERYSNYVLVNSNGDVYKIIEEGKKIILGNIKNMTQWDKILKNI